MNTLLLVSVPLDVVTVIGPVVAPDGTVALRNVEERTVEVAGVPLKETWLVLVKPWPRICTSEPTV